MMMMMIGWMLGLTSNKVCQVANVFYSSSIKLQNLKLLLLAHANKLEDINGKEDTQNRTCWLLMSSYPMFTSFAKTY